MFSPRDSINEARKTIAALHGEIEALKRDLADPEKTVSSSIIQYEIGVRERSIERGESRIRDWREQLDQILKPLK